MKIAVTADIHLKADDKEGNKYPERLNALRYILDSILKDGIRNLIIAGDLFDIESQNYSVFDQLCRESKYSGINIYIVPGNHDPAINPKYFTAASIKVFSDPKILTLNNSSDFLQEASPGSASTDADLLSFFFIPYVPGKSMGEILAEYKQILPRRWVLIGHGDYLSGIKIPNIYETGVYMPLGRSDIEFYNPAIVILGHIHKKMQTGKVIYPGSPCGMDINETGRRSFIVVDSNDLGVTEKPVKSDYLFFIENFLVLPTAKEFDDIKTKIEDITSSWKLDAAEVEKARIRIKVRGYTSDKNKLASVIKESFAHFKYYDSQGPDMSEVSLFNDPDRVGIVERVKTRIDLLEKADGYTREKRDMILEQALNLILKE